MARYGSPSRSRFLPVLLVIIIMIVAIIAIVSLARSIFFSDGGDEPDTAQIDDSRSALLSTDAQRSVRMTIRGPIVANETFHSYRVSVSPSNRNLTTYRGYIGEQVGTANLSNNTNAYEQFVHALDKANLSVGTPLEGEHDDTRGVCATGQVFEFEIINNGDIVKRLWTSSCNGSPGSLRASSRQLQALFEEQIPNAEELTEAIGL